MNKKAAITATKWVFIGIVGLSVLLLALEKLSEILDGYLLHFSLFCFLISIVLAWRLIYKSNK
jgi:hypothetical protein